MYCFVIALEQVEACSDASVERSEPWKVILILDLMMAFEVTEVVP